MLDKLFEVVSHLSQYFYYVHYANCLIVIYQILTKYVNVISKQFLFQQLGVIIAIVKQHIRNYLNDIFTIIKVQSLQYF